MSALSLNARNREILVSNEELTIFFHAAEREAAHLAIRRALQSMFPAAAQDFDEVYCNLISASELTDEGRSERSPSKPSLFILGEERLPKLVGKPAMPSERPVALHLRRRAIARV
jgi:hypothetical protein